jgi:hypothetical protein
MRKQVASANNGAAARPERRVSSGLGFGWLMYFFLRIVSVAGTFAVSYQEQHPQQIIPRLYVAASFPAALSLPFLLISPFAILALRKSARTKGRSVSLLAFFDLVMYGLMIAFLVPLVL